jgi:hypothetical protein
MTEKIWIYVLNRELNSSELEKFLQDCKGFTSTWTAHDQPLSASFELYKNRLLIVRVDETAYNASGCSIDKLQRFIQQQEKGLNIELLNRMIVAMEVNDELMVVHSSKIKELLTAGIINEQTRVFDTTITSSVELKDWKKPLKNTWLSKYTEGISR